MAEDAHSHQQQSQQGTVLRGINWREAFPFTNIFRAFRVAIHPSKLLLGLAALLALYFGGRLLDAFWMDKHEPTSTEFGMFDVHAIDMDGDIDEARGFLAFFGYEVAQVNHVAQAVIAGNWLGPASVTESICNFIVRGPLILAREHPFYGLVLGIWFLIVWSIFGGAISRIAAVHVARDEKISVRQALRLSTGKLLSFFFAPVIPLLIVFAVGLVVAIGGLLLYIPIVGPIVVSLIFFLALIGGFIMTLVLLGMIGGMNLMYPTIAVEGSDSFDAISRSFSYVYARPWRMLFYTALAVLYGALTYLFVRLFIFLLLLLTHWFVGAFLEGQSERHWYGEPGYAAMWQAPDFSLAGFYDLPYNIDYDGLKWSEDFAAGMISFWVYLVIGMLGAYAISFYFSANTIIYYLMRQEVDATELDDVYVEQAEEDFADTMPPAAPAGTTTTTAPAGGSGSASTPTTTGTPAPTEPPSSPPPPVENPPPPPTGSDQA